MTTDYSAPTRLVLTRAVRDEVVAHARAEYPNEAVGLLARRPDSGSVIMAISLTNMAGPTAHMRAVVDRRALKAAHRRLSDLGLEPAGAYHSHTTRIGARWSGVDALRAPLGEPQLIVSVRPDGLAAVLAWLARVDRCGMDELPVELIDGREPPGDDG